MTIGDRIRRKRIELGMSQEELADKLGFKSRSSVNKIEKDARNLTQSRIKAIADVLQTTPEYIMGWDEPVPTDSYYMDNEVKEYAETLKNNAGMRILFDTCKDATPEELLTIIDMVRKMKK